MKSEKKQSALLKFIFKHRDKLFLYMCFCIHLSYLISFVFAGIWSLALVNLFSVSLYALFILYAYKKNDTEKMMLAAYYEILAFSAVSEILTHGCMEFFPYMVGIIPGIVCVTPSYSKKHLQIQFSGIVVALTVFLAKHSMPDYLFSKTYTLALQYGRAYSHINLFITLCTIVYSAFFYEMELQASRDKLRYNSTHDMLTGLYNRRFLYDNLKKNCPRNFSVAILDIDHFKRINDSFGHDKGDEVLASVASVITQNVDNNQYAVRWGGEEFVIYFSESESESVYRLVNTICSSISEKVILPDNTNVTVTAGVVCECSDDFDKAVKKADEYLYSGKQNGRNCIVWHKNERDFKVKA